VLFKIAALVLILTCSFVAPAQETEENLALAARRVEFATRAQRAYEQIVAAQTDPLAATAEEVIDRSIAAMGGRETLASLRTLSMTSTGYMVGGKFGATRLLKAPNFIRQERNGGLFVVTNGITAWRVEGDDWQPLPSGGSTWQQVFSITLDLVDHEAKNVTYDFVGTVALEGGAFYKLRKTISTGKQVFVYFDIATGLLTMEEEFGENGRMVNLFFDHREVGGVLLPHMRVRLADVLDTAHVALLSYEANPPIDDALFEPKTSADSDRASIQGDLKR
jgi:hypothetical protein